MVRYRQSALLSCIGLALLLPSAFGQAIGLVPIGHYAPSETGIGAAEIVCYHPPTQQLFSVNGKDCTLDVVSLSDPTAPRLVRQLPLNEFGSVPTAVSTRDDLIATCMLGATHCERGRVVFTAPDGKVLGAVTVGWHPDMLSFSPDGRYLVVANEGEPSSDGQHDGEGSVSVIAVPSPLTDVASLEVRDAHFHEWNQRPLPTGAFRVEATKPTSQDVEPEAIAISADSATAYVTLQENNALAVVDLSTGTVTRIIGLGYQDHSRTGSEIDVGGSGDAAQIRTVPLRGMYQPDNVGWFEASGRSFLILANEGDARANAAYQDDVVLGKVPLDAGRFPDAAALQSADGLGGIAVSLQGDTDGDGDLDELYTFGSRSVTIIDEQGKKVFDSGSQLERLVAERVRRLTDRPINSMPTYRTKRGPEPEGLAIGLVDGRTLAFIGLERDSGIAVFDVTYPESASCVGYVHPGDFVLRHPEVAGDCGPEGLAFVSVRESPTHEPLLLVANEASGSITVYAVHSMPADPVAARK